MNDSIDINFILYQISKETKLHGADTSPRLGKLIKVEYICTVNVYKLKEPSPIYDKYNISFQLLFKRLEIWLSQESSYFLIITHGKFNS